MLVTRRNQDFMPTLFNELLNWNDTTYSTPRMNIMETKDNYKLELCIPGLTKDDVKLTSCPYAWAVRQCFVSLMSVRSSTSDDLETVLMTRACEKKGEFF